MTPERDDGADARHWRRESLRYDLLHERAALVARLAADAAPTCVLELGCSTGRLARELRRLRPDVAYFGTDISAEALDAVDEGRVAQADLNHDPLPFEDRRFDCIIGSGVLEYIDDVPGLLAAVASRLTAGGTVVVSYVNRSQVKRRVSGALRRPQGDPTWRPLLSLRELLAAAAAAGLHQPEIHAVRGHISPSERSSRGHPPRTRPTTWLELTAPQVVIRLTTTGGGESSTTS